MEVRRQGEEIGMPTSLGCDLRKRESSSRLASTPFAQTVEEKTRDETIQHEETNSSPPQTLDQNHLTYHLHFPHGRQLNSLPQLSGKPGEGPDSKQPDLGPAPTTPVAGRLSSKTPSQPSGSTALTIYSPVRYRECLKNHAASMGGYALDGCGEFMLTGEENSFESLKCAVCDCHRNFHRKEVDGGASVPSLANCYDPYNSNNTTIRRSNQRLAPQPPHLNHHRQISLGPQAPMMMIFGRSGGAAAESSSEDLAMSYQAKSSKKRFRTKFTQQQKVKMLEFADRLGWKIQKHDEEDVEQFCAGAGLKRQVFKMGLTFSRRDMFLLRDVVARRRSSCPWSDVVNLCLFSSSNRAFCIAGSLGLASASAINRSNRFSGPRNGNQLSQSDDEIISSGFQVVTAIPSRTQQLEN